MCIAIVCFPCCNDGNFKINLNFLIKPFFYMKEKSRQKFKNLANEKTFLGDTMLLQCTSFYASFHNSNKQAQPYKTESATKNFSSI